MERTYLDWQWFIVKVFGGGVSLYLLWNYYGISLLQWFFYGVGVCIFLCLARFFYGVVHWLWDLCTVSHGGRWHRVLHLSPRQFEFFVGELFRLRGYRVEVTSRSADHGHDLLLYKKKHGTYVPYLCEVKQYSAGNKVGEARIRDFMGALEMAGVHHGVYVTTSSFTRHALALGEDRGLTLLDGDDLQQWMMSYSRREFMLIYRKCLSFS